jgi:hypothetical protein
MYKNLAISTVATAPSPASSGTSLVVAAGQGARFPQPSTDGSFPVTIYPAGEIATPDNAEICLCTARSTDTLTLTRTWSADTPSARTALVGDRVMSGICAENWTPYDIGAVSSSNLLTVGEETFDRYNIVQNKASMLSGYLWLTCFTARKTETINSLRMATGVTAAAATPDLVRWGIYSIDGSSNLHVAFRDDRD